MSDNPIKLIVGLIAIIALAVIVAIAGGDQGQSVVIALRDSSFTISVFCLCACLAFLINWLAYIPAILAKTEHFYDLVGSITYLTVVAVSVYFVSDLDWRAILVSSMVVLWALRLGLFLFVRVRKAGRDDRFDLVKVNPLKFLVAWSLQALWVLLTVACALVIITNNNQQAIDLITVTGIICWLIGFSVEVIADHQKRIFRNNIENEAKFINSGLWAFSQHPNYFGEILLWFGMSLIALPVLEGWQWLALISPLFVYFLLTKGSGIPTLEEKALSKWGSNVDYQAYVSNTPLLFPQIFKPSKLPD